MNSDHSAHCVKVAIRLRLFHWRRSECKFWRESEIWRKKNKEL